jgi:DNA-binding transcriptional MerR regulator
MARRARVDGLSIAQLEQMLQDRRTQQNQLQKERTKLLQRLDQIEAQIRQLGGSVRGGGRGRGGGGGTRARNAQSLVACIETVLKDAGKPMKVGDITAGVQKCGYRSNSANFRSIVNQTLIKERKRFGQAGRGVYQLKKAG